MKVYIVYIMQIFNNSLFQSTCTILHSTRHHGLKVYKLVGCLLWNQLEKQAKWVFFCLLKTGRRSNSQESIWLMFDWRIWILLESKPQLWHKTKSESEMLTQLSFLKEQSQLGLKRVWYNVADCSREPSPCIYIWMHSFGVAELRSGF